MMPPVNVSKIQVHHLHFLNCQTGAIMHNRIMQKLNTPKYVSELASNSLCSRQLKTLFFTFLKTELSRYFWYALRFSSSKVSFSAVSKFSSIKMWLSMTGAFKLPPSLKSMKNQAKI